MQRSKNHHDNSRIPDAINQSLEEDYARIPNDILRNPDLSFRAKGVLCLLLSNRDGWKSYMNTLLSFTIEGKEAIRKALVELETNGYLRRVQYRDIHTKHIIGYIWAYTNEAFVFNDTVLKEKLSSYQVEMIHPITSKKNINSPEDGNPEAGKPGAGYPASGNQPLIRYNNNNTKNNNTKKNSSSPSWTFSSKNTSAIIPSQFDEFWAMYPRHIDKGKAKTKWDSICNKPKSSRPTVAQIVNALTSQKESERWSDSKFIPYPATWLNQQRWLDDKDTTASGAVVDDTGNPETDDNTAMDIIASSFKSKDMRKIFIRHCWKPAKALMNLEGTSHAKVARNLCELYNFILAEQGRAPEHMIMVLPGPTQIIQDYIQWLDDNDWIQGRGPDLFKGHASLFSRFRRAEAHKDNFERDPLTGISYR